jgi:hypothetical protein
VEYLVKYEGYNDSYDEGVHPIDWHHDDELVQEFHARYPDKPKPKRSEYADTLL